MTKTAMTTALVEANIVDENALLNDLLMEIGGEEVAAAGDAPDEILEEALPHAAIEPEVEAAVSAGAEDDADESADLTEAEVEPEAEPIVEPTVEPEVKPEVEAAAHDAVLDEIAAAAALHEATQAAYAETNVEAPTSDADKPSDDPYNGVEITVLAPKGKGKPKAAVRSGPPLSKSEKVVAKLGDKANEFLILELADAELDEEALKLKQDAAKAEIDGLAKKVGEKATILFGWLKNGGTLNEVMKRAFEVLVRDGELTSGVKGNLQTNLLSKPYSPGTAASQANQMFMLLPVLRVTKKEKGRMVINEDSLILAKVKAELGL